MREEKMKYMATPDTVVLDGFDLSGHRRIK
jgi:hypothetical protein